MRDSDLHRRIQSKQQVYVIQPEISDISFPRNPHPVSRPVRWNPVVPHLVLRPVEPRSPLSGTPLAAAPHPVPVSRPASRPRRHTPQSIHIVTRTGETPPWPPARGIATRWNPVPARKLQVSESQVRINRPEARHQADPRLLALLGDGAPNNRLGQDSYDWEARHATGRVEILYEGVRYTRTHARPLHSSSSSRY